MNRIRVQVTALLCALCIACAAVSVHARNFWAYYDCTPGMSTVIVLTNASEFSMEDAVQLRLYDETGALISESVHGFEPYESTAVFLNSAFSETDESMWGLAEIDTRLLLQVGVWVGTEERWLFVENSGELLADTSHLSIDAYWYGAQFANTRNRRTTVTILNPQDHPVVSEISLFDAHGELQYQRTRQLAPRKPSQIDLVSSLPVGEDTWGLLDVATDAPVLLVCSYFSMEDGSLIDVDIIDQPYYLGIADRE